MKNHIPTSLFICFLLFTGGCANEDRNTAQPTDITQPSEAKNKPLVKSEKIMKAKIIEMQNDTILVADTEENSGLYQVFADALLGDISPISVGDMVEIGFDGSVLEIYPAIIANVDYIMLLEKGENFVGLYHDIFMKLYDTDTALNSDISFIALDLTKDKNLNDSEKNALLYLLWNTTQVETRLATYQDLLSENLITLDGNSDFAQLETGILFILETSEVEMENVTFTAEKWRSSLGAHCFNDCHAKKVNGEWHYEIGGEK
ncbi:MAG: hypothetical protein EOM28_05490 [Clostridia bacterium]|nr:hypothetical protein [Clostridia bacterium]